MMESGPAHVQVHAPLTDFVHLDGGAEGGRSLALEDGLLHAAATSLVVSEGDADDAPHEIVERGVLEQVLRRAETHNTSTRSLAHSPHGLPRCHEPPQPLLTRHRVFLSEASQLTHSPPQFTHSVT